MKQRTSKVRNSAKSMKVKCWKKLVSIAMGDEIDQNTIAALESIINIAEPVINEENEYVLHSD